MAKTIAKGVGQVGQGLSTFGELLPPVEFEEGSAIKLIPGKNEKKKNCWRTIDTKKVKKAENEALINVARHLIHNDFSLLKTRLRAAFINFFLVEI